MHTWFLTLLQAHISKWSLPHGSSIPISRGLLSIFLDPLLIYFYYQVELLHTQFFPIFCWTIFEDPLLFFQVSYETMTLSSLSNSMQFIYLFLPEPGFQNFYLVVLIFHFTLFHQHILSCLCIFKIQILLSLKFKGLVFLQFWVYKIVTTTKTWQLIRFLKNLWG